MNQTVGSEKEVQQTDKIYRPRAVPDDACVDFPGSMAAGDQVRKVERRIVIDYPRKPKKSLKNRPSSTSLTGLSV